MMTSFSWSLKLKEMCSQFLSSCKIPKTRVVLTCKNWISLYEACDLCLILETKEYLD